MNGRLTERERLDLLRVFDNLLGKIPLRPRSNGEKELKAIRRARRSGGRKTRVET